MLLTPHLYIIYIALDEDDLQTLSPDAKVAMTPKVVEALLHQLTYNRPHCSFVAPRTSSHILLTVSSDNFEMSLKVAREHLEKKSATLYYAICSIGGPSFLVRMDLKEKELTLCDPSTPLPRVFL